PAAGLMTTLPKGDKQIRVIQADLPTLLAKNEGQYLHLISIPLRIAYLGKEFTYQLDALSNQSPITYSVETGPEGMTVDKDGQIKWVPRIRPKGGTEDVIVSARTDSGKEVFQSFSINVERDGLGPASAQPSPRTQPRSRSASSDENERKPATNREPRVTTKSA